MVLIICHQHQNVFKDNTLSQHYRFSLDSNRQKNILNTLKINFFADVNAALLHISSTLFDLCPDNIVCFTHFSTKNPLDIVLN